MKYVKFVLLLLLAFSFVTGAYAETISTYADQNSLRGSATLTSDGRVYVVVRATHIADKICVNTCQLQCFNGVSWRTVATITIPGNVTDSACFASDADCSAYCEDGKTYRVQVSFIIDGYITNDYFSPSTTF